MEGHNAAMAAMAEESKLLHVCYQALFHHRLGSFFKQQRCSELCPENLSGEADKVQSRKTLLQDAVLPRRGCWRNARLTLSPRVGCCRTSTPTRGAM